MTVATSDTGRSYAPGPIGIGVLGLLACLPLRLSALLGTGLGEFAYALDKKRRRIISVNLKLCFPELAPAEARRLMRLHFRVLGRSMLCSVAIAWCRCEQRLRRRVRLRGEHHYYDALERGAVILMAPHFVNLELGWLRVALERPMAGMYREPRKHLFHWAVNRRRMQFGGVRFERGANLKPLIRLMRNGYPFYYLPDIDPGDKTPHVFAPFFGVPAATVTALSRIARMTDAAVVPCIVRELSWGRYQIKFLPPLENFPSGDALVDAQRMNALVEAEVRKAPAQYLWIHRRFKTRPPGEASRYD